MNVYIVDEDYAGLLLVFKPLETFEKKIKLLYTSHRSMLTSRHKNVIENRCLLLNSQSFLF